MNKPFYITTTLPYVNSDPHVGFATELIRADVIARYKKLLGHEVFFNTGTDEHGQKLFDAAKKEGVDTQTYVDRYAVVFKELKGLLGISEDIHFIRTTDKNHIKAAQEFWKRCYKNGFIEKKPYQAKYCVGCELEKTDSELVDGKCPLHPNRDIELINEENYFFKFSAFGEKLENFYNEKENEDFVVPSYRLNEIKSLIAEGLKDFSISRVKHKMSWGVPVPGDDEHVMYVWFEALVSYISTLGWPNEGGDYQKYWKNGTKVQYCGKDNLRQQCAMWQAMLMAAELPNSNKVIVDGFITGEAGAKMSKSVGNVINPYDVVKEYGADALRYFVLSELSSFEDSPFTMDRFKESYNSGLANGIGNLTSRIMTLSETLSDGEHSLRVVNNIIDDAQNRRLNPFLTMALDNFDINMACKMIWNHISKLDKRISEEAPFKMIKVDREKASAMFTSIPGPEEYKDSVSIADAKNMNVGYLFELAIIAFELEIILPNTSKKIIEIMRSNKKPTEPLFLRKD